MPEIGLKRPGYYFFEVTKGRGVYYIYINKSIKIDPIRSFLRGMAVGTEALATIEVMGPVDVLKASVSLLDLYNLDSGQHSLKFNFMDKTSRFYLLILTRSLITVNINHTNGDDVSVDPIKVNKDLGSNSFCPSFVEKSRVMSLIRFYSKLFSTLNKNYSSDLVFSKTIKIMLSLILDESLIQEIKRESRMGLVRTNTFYKFNVNYNISILDSVSLYSNIFPFKIDGAYSYSMSYQSFSIWSKSKNTQHLQNKLNKEPLLTVMGAPVFLRLSGLDLYNILLDFTPILKMTSFLKSVGDLSLLSTIELQEVTENVELLLYKIYADLRRKIDEESLVEASLKYDLSKLISFSKREGLLDFCLGDLEVPSGVDPKTIKDAFISDITELDDNIGKINEIKACIKSARQYLKEVDLESENTGDLEWLNFRDEIKEELISLNKGRKEGSDSIARLNYRIFFLEKIFLRKSIGLKLDENSKQCINRHDLSKNKLNSLNSKYSNFLSLISLIALIKRGVSKGLYYPLFKDSRGRTYSYCPTHPIYNRVIRPFLEFESNLDSNSIQNSRYYKAIDSLTFSPAFLEKLEKSYKKSGSNLKFGLYKYFVSVLSVEIFKFHKNSYISLFAGGGLELSFIVEEGFSMRLEPINIFDKVDEKFYFFKLVRSLNNLVEKGVILNMTLTRDSTASFIQH